MQADTLIAGANELMEWAKHHISRFAISTSEPFLEFISNVEPGFGYREPVVWV